VVMDAILLTLRGARHPGERRARTEVATTRLYADFASPAACSVFRARRSRVVGIPRTIPS
jgi:hypothetical protein